MTTYSLKIKTYTLNFSKMYTILLILCMKKQTIFALENYNNYNLITNIYYNSSIK